MIGRMNGIRNTLDSLTERFAQAWNAHDVAALGAVFDEDADFVDPSGNIWHGGAAIAAEHRRLFRGPLAQSSLRCQVAKARMLSRTSGIMYGIWSMTGHTDERARYLPVRTGLWLFVVRRASGGWRIVCAQITDMPA